MTTYDPPGITNPENVDALSHQQIYDAFQTVGQSCGDVVSAWQQAGRTWRTSTTGLVRAVRSAVDGHWTGASADAALGALADYGKHAGNLADLFDAAGQAVSDTAQAALTTKAYIPKPVPVSADQTKDPAGFDRQTREANKAQDEARQVMQQRYVLPFTEQDKKIPTFPDAVSPLNGDGTTPASSSAFEDPAASIAPAAWDGTDPDFTTPASMTSLLHDLPLPAPADSALSGLLPDSAATPQMSDVLFRQPSMDDPSPAGGDADIPSPSAAQPGTPADSAPTAPSSVHDVGSALEGPHGDPDDVLSQQQNSAGPQWDTDRPGPGADTSAAPADTRTAGMHDAPVSEGVRPGHESMANPPAGAAAPGGPATPGVQSGGSPGPLPGASTPNLAGPALGGAAGAIPAAPVPAAPAPSAPIPNAPVPNTPAPSAPTPLPATPAPTPVAPAPSVAVPNIPAPAPAPAPAPNIQAPAPGTSAPHAAPKPVPGTPVPGTGAPPASAQPSPARTTVGPLPADVLAEPAGAAVAGAATAEVLSDPGGHHPGPDHRAPRLRIRYEGDRDRVGKKVELQHDTTAEMAGRDEHVQPTIGE